MSVTDRLAEIEELANAATEGPWTWEATTPSMTGAAWNLRISGKPGIRLSVREYQHGSANAEFITAARTDVPALVAALHEVLEVCDKALAVKANGSSEGEAAMAAFAAVTKNAITSALGEKL